MDIGRLSRLPARCRLNANITRLTVKASAC